MAQGLPFFLDYDLVFITVCVNYSDKYLRRKSSPGHSNGQANLGTLLMDEAVFPNPGTLPAPPQTFLGVLGLFSFSLLRKNTWIVYCCRIHRIVTSVSQFTSRFHELLVVFSRVIREAGGIRAHDDCHTQLCGHGSASTL